MCLYPRLIKNRKYIANKKNGGVIPAILDKRVLTVSAGCGKCIECKKQKCREWQVRLNEEIRNNNKAEFVTLTFSDQSIKELIQIINKGSEQLDGYDLDNEIATLATRRFLERWRKKNKTSVKHWLITELGHNGTENIHMHGIIWSKNKEEIINTWKYGHVFIGTYVSEQTINYIVKYVNKIDQQHTEYNSKILCSPGIGKNYINRIDSNKNKYKENKTDESYQTRTGLKLALPIYYRNKIYTEEQKEKLWIEKLDKETRYICGEKINITENEEIYYKTLEYYRTINN